MSRLRGRSQNSENQEPCPAGAGAAFQRKHSGAAKARLRFIGLLLALVTLLVYLPVCHYQFVTFDDNDYVAKNHIVQQGLTWAGVKWAFMAGHANNWHPLTWLSHMLDCELFGLNAGAHHSVNVLFHAANAVLLFVLLLRMTNALWPGAFVAALFAWHPLHVESVAWISERKDVLSTLFALLTLLAYVRHAKSAASDKRQVTDEEKNTGTPVMPRVTRHVSLYLWLALIFYALGLMSKPMLVTLPFVMLLLDFWPLKRVTGDQWQVAGVLRLAFEKRPFFLLAAVSCIVTVFAQHSGGAVVPLALVPLRYRLVNAVTAYLDYFLKMLWPANLAVLYPLPAHLLRTQFFAATVFLIVISCWVWKTRRTRPYLLVGWLWFLGTLVPVIGLVQVGGAALADRYTYLPSIGVFLAVAFGVRDLAARFSIPKTVITVAAAAILAACLLLTEHQLRYWRDSESLFTRALVVTRDNAVAHLNLGSAFQDEGKLTNALAEYRDALRLAPGFFYVHNDLGSLLEELGEPAEALAEYRQALRINPNVSALHDGIGIALAELGHFDEAMNEFTNAARLDPAYSWPYFQMGKVLLEQGRDAEAVGRLRGALRIDPDNFQILAYTARVLVADENPRIRDGQTALEYAARANVLAGGSQPFVLDVLGMACAEIGHFDDAQAVTQKAVELAGAAGMSQSVADMQRRLDLYKSHQPWRESFRFTDAPPEKSPKN
jgi:protein O-mannosyl-transferase